MENLFLELGYVGMLLASFLAGTVFPCSSEVIMMALISIGFSSWGIVLTATIGNTIGSLTCYWVGTLGKMEWIERYFKVNHEKLVRAEHFVKRYGAWIGFFSFLPVIGEAIAIVLGILHAPLWTTTIAMTAGKFIRYALVAFVTEGIVLLF